MSGIEVTKRSKKYEVDVLCPRCGSEVHQDAEGKRDKFRRVYALRCVSCKTLFSLNLLLRSESGNNLSGR